MGSIQWSAPEVLMGQEASKEADIFALAMVMVEGCHERYTTSQSYLPLLSINAGLQRDHAVWQCVGCTSDPLHNTGQASTATNTSRCLKGIVGIDRTVLGRTS